MKKNIFIIAVSILVFLAQSLIIQGMESQSELLKASKLQEALQLIAPGKLAEFSKLIQEANFDLKSPQGTILITHAVAAGQKPIIEFLLNKGVNINDKDNYGATALMYSYDPEIMKLLFKYGANPFIRNKDGKTVYDLLTERANEIEEVKERITNESAKERIEKEYKKYIELANLAKEWEDYKEYLNKFRSTSAAILTTSILPLLQKRVNEGRMTQEEFNEIKNGLRPIPRDVVKLIQKEFEPTFDEWFINIRKK